MSEGIELNLDDARTLMKKLMECAEQVDDIARDALSAADDLEEAWEHPELSHLTAEVMRNEGKNLTDCALTFTKIKQGIDETIKGIEQAIEASQLSCNAANAGADLPRVVVGAGWGHGDVTRKPKSPTVTSGATSVGGQ